MEDETPARAPTSTSGPDEPQGDGGNEPAPPSSPGAPASPPGPSYRILFAVLWVAVQAVLIVTAGRRPDGAFGFRMFNESSTVRIALFREVDGPDGNVARIHVDGGVWSARGSDGVHHRLTWYDRVPTPYWIFDQEMHASYGAKAQLSRLQGALDDVARHLAPSDDVETRRLVLDVTVRRNGREPVLHRLTSRERALSPVPRTNDGGP